MPSALIRLLERRSSLSFLDSEGNTLTNGGCLYTRSYLLQKGSFHSVVVLFLCLQFLKNSQPKILLMPKRHILGWQILLPPVAMNMHVEAFVWIYVFNSLGVCSGTELLGSYEELPDSSTMAPTTCTFLPVVSEDSNFSTYSPSLVIFFARIYLFFYEVLPFFPSCALL